METPMTARAIFTVLALCAAGACTTVPPAPVLRAMPTVLPSAAEGVPADGRASFRARFCALARDSAATAGDDACADWLWRLDDEPPPAAAPPDRPLDGALRVFIVGGAFSDCYGARSVAWRGATERLSAAGLRVSSLPINGRSSADHNARLIAEAFAEAPPSADDRVIMVGYSKGAIDALHFLANHPEQARVVDALVSVAGPIHGSRVADRGAWLYDTFLQRSFAGRCDPGDGGVVDSLRVETRQAWLAEHGLPDGVRYYSLAAFTTREHIARALMPSWRILAREDVRNDGQVAVSEALLPGSTLLAFVNADHWDLAIDIEDELKMLAKRRDGREFPHGLLFEAIVRHVASDLAPGPAAAAAASGLEP